jgi:hypothetical protein
MGIPGERNSFRDVPKVTLSALQCDSAIRASAARTAAAVRRDAGADVSRTEARAKVPQKVTPWKNYLAEKTPLIGIIARHGVSPCGSQFQPSFCLTLRARSARTRRLYFAQTGHSHSALKCEIPGFDFRRMRRLYSRHILACGIAISAFRSCVRGKQLQRGAA